MKDKTKTYPVDGIKLYAHLKKRKLSPADASREIGYSENYISNSVHKKRITNRGAILLEKLFDICPEDYAPDCIEEMIEKAKPS